MRSIPSPGDSGILMNPFSTWKGFVEISFPNDSRFIKYSVIRKFGIAAETCNVAARPIVVLLKLCGETATKYGEEQERCER